MPICAPCSPAHFPKIASGWQQDLKRARARVGIADRQAQLSIPSLGETRVTCHRVGPAHPPPRGASCWRLRNGQRAGWLIVDPLACLSVVAATLGLPAPRVHRRPTRIEAGIVAATLAAMVRAGGGEQFTLELDEQPWADEHLIELELEIACKTFRERGLVHVPIEWIPPCPPAEIAASAIERRLRVSVSLEAATTTLPAGDWSRARIDDAIVFDGFAALPPAGPWSLSLRSGRYLAAAALDEASTIRVSSPFELAETAPRPTRAGPEAGRQEGRQLMANDERTADYARLATAPVEVVAEVGQLVLLAEEIIALQPGSLISLQRPRTQLVELKIAGATWARGELVDVDGELAVRITELAPRHTRPDGETT